MAPDPITAALDQLAANREHITTLDTREASHFAEVNGQLIQLASMTSALGRALVDNTAAIARLDALDRQVSDLLAITRMLSAQAEYQARILPALAAQLAAETTRCGHRPAPGYPRSDR